MTATMASQGNQAMAPSATKLVLPITGGSSFEPANKKQKKEAQRRVQHVGVQGPFIKSKWSHIQSPSLRKTFSSKIILTMMQGYILCHQGVSSSQCPCRHRQCSGYHLCKKLSGRCRSRMTRYMMQHTPSVALEEGR
jgi:hypothetical protein